MADGGTHITRQGIAAPRARHDPRTVLVSVLAVLALLLGLTGNPALALGEDGPFDLPLATSELPVEDGRVLTYPLAEVVAAGALPELDLSTAQLAIPDEARQEMRSRMRLSEDGTALVIRGEGVWSISQESLSFEPDADFTGAPSSIALTLQSIHGTRSRPALLRVTAPRITEHTISASEGHPVTIDLTIENDAIRPGAQRLTLEGMPAGSVLTAEGTRLVVLDQGTWQLDDNGTRVTFRPAADRLGGSPSTLHYVVLPDGGAYGDEPVATGTVSIQTPFIQDMNRSAPYGEPIIYSVFDAMRSVDPASLRLVAVPGASGITVADDGLSARSDQGSWHLDSERGIVSFTPASADVVVTPPIGIRGADPRGFDTSVALLRTGYPSIADAVSAAQTGQPVIFHPLATSRDVRADTLRFSSSSAPEGARVRSDGLEMTIDGEGVWSIDAGAGTVTFSPDEGLTGSTATPVVIHGSGLYADTTTAAVLTAQFAPAVPTLRDDEMRSAAGEAARIDVLANDSPATPNQALVPDDLQIRSLQAVNLGDLGQWRGDELVIPREGTYRVEPEGVVSFTPADGFIGRTTPIQYTIKDTAGVEAQAWVSFDVDPTVPPAGRNGSDSTGIVGLLGGIMPGRSGSFAVYALVVVLLVFAGLTSLWIGIRMEQERRLALTEVSRRTPLA